VVWAVSQRSPISDTGAAEVDRDNAPFLRVGWAAEVPSSEEQDATRSRSSPTCGFEASSDKYIRAEVTRIDGVEVAVPDRRIHLIEP